MAIQANNIADLVTTTLRELGRGKWTDNSSAYYDTVVAKHILNKRQTKMLDNGYEISFNRMTGLSNSARFNGLGAPDVVDITNQMGTGTVPWRHLTYNWAWDYRTLLMNRGPSQIVEYIRTQRIAATGSMIELLETAAWRAPALTDDTSLYGIPYWVVKSNTAATVANNNGFNGLAPSGWTTVAGINPTTDTRWRNYATQYTIVSKDDFVRKARRMAKMTGFKPLVDNTPQYDTGAPREYYTNNAVESTLVEILESQNENLGMDIAPYEGKTMFNRSKVNFIQALDDDTTNPFYQLDMGVMGARGLSGAWMKETAIANVPGQHTLSATHVDCTMNLICLDRRKCGVLATDTGLPA